MLAATVKQESNRQKIETLYVLGAGASFGLTAVKTKKYDFSRIVAPLDTDFLRVLDHFKPSKGWRRASTRLSWKNGSTATLLLTTVSRKLSSRGLANMNSYRAFIQLGSRANVETKNT